MEIGDSKLEFQVDSKTITVITQVSFQVSNRYLQTIFCNGFRRSGAVLCRNNCVTRK